MRRARWLIGVVALPATVLGILWAREVDDSLVVRVDPGRPGVVLSWDPRTSTTGVLYRAAGAVSRLEVSPDGRRVAVLELEPGVLEDEGYARVPRSRLRIVNRQGRLEHSIDDVWHVAWSPDGGQVAYVTGSHLEGGIGFAPEATLLLTLRGAETRPLPGLAGAYELHWLRAAGEDALYANVATRAEAHHVRRLDMDSGDFDRPRVQAIRFSPDGRYYLLRPYESIERGLCGPGRAGDTCLRVYERRGDRPIPELSATKWGEPLGWVGDEDHHLLFAASDRGRITARGSVARLRIVDAAAARAIEVVEPKRLGGAGLQAWRTASGRPPALP